MDTGDIIKTTQDKIVAALNESRLHPAVLKLILANIMSAVDNAEREARAQQAAQAADEGKQAKTRRGEVTP